MKRNLSHAQTQIGDTLPSRPIRHQRRVAPMTVGMAMLVVSSMASSAAAFASPTSAAAASKTGNATFCANVATYKAADARIPTDFATDDVVPPNFRADSLEVAKGLTGQFAAAAAGVTTKASKSAAKLIMAYTEKRNAKLIEVLDAAADDLAAYQAVLKWQLADYPKTTTAQLIKLAAAGNTFDKEVTKRCGRS